MLHPGPTHGNTKHMTYLPTGEVQAGAIHNLRDIDEKLIYNVPEIIDQNEASEIIDVGHIYIVPKIIDWKQHGWPPFIIKGVL